MNWASDCPGNIPEFKQVYVAKSSISNEDNFKEFVRLSGLSIIAEEDHYYILDGSAEELLEFSNDWKS